MRYNLNVQEFVLPKLNRPGKGYDVGPARIKSSLAGNLYPKGMIIPGRAGCNAFQGKQIRSMKTEKLNCYEYIKDL